MFFMATSLSRDCSSEVNFQRLINVCYFQEYANPPAYAYHKPASLQHSSYGDMFQGMNGMPTTFIASASRASTQAKNTGKNLEMAAPLTLYNDEITICQ